jgi:hypothetical protein
VSKQHGSVRIRKSGPSCVLHPGGNYLLDKTAYSKFYFQGCAGKIVKVFEQHFGYLVCAGLGMLLLGMEVNEIY